MASTIDHFGPISQGYDRAQLGVGPPINETDNVRPPDSTPQRRQSLHVIISDNIPGLLSHPRRGFRRFKNAVDERRSNHSSPTYPGNAPLLAPPPTVDVVPARLNHEVQDTPKVPPFKEIVAHPVATVRSLITDRSGVEFSENLAKSEVPHGASVILLRQDKENSNASTAEEAADGLTKLTQLKHLRQDAFVRWTIDRHVREVRKIPSPTVKLSGQKPGSTHRQWVANAKLSLQERFVEHAQYYLDESPDWPLPSRQILVSSAERIIVASTQAQSWYMDMRDIAHWLNPRVTAYYAAAYLLLILTGHVPSMVLLYLIYKILARRQEVPDLRSMWESVTTYEDKDQTPRHLSELVIQYGTQGWIDHAIDRIGPALFLKLDHVADIFEMVQNFYEWRDPTRTTTSLCMLGILWLVVTFLPGWLLVKALFLFIGIDFFVLTPIAYHYPQFRLLVSPFTWTLWRIPTHADWALARLQAEGKEHLLQRNRRDQGQFEQELTKRGEGSPVTVVGEAQDIGTYQCEIEPKGRLKVTTSSVTFRAVKEDRESWSLILNDLKSLKKISEPTRTDNVYGLQFTSTTGLTYRIMGLQRRDEIFSQIVGYSDVRFKRVG